MIVFDLACSSAHVFEAWFGSSADFDDQQSRGLLACPLCGCQKIVKAPMAPAVRTGSEGPRCGAIKEMLAALATAQARALEGSTWVGKRFADEARAMHLGETDHRPIHGQASAEQAIALASEGVPIAPLPLPVVPPDEAN